MTHDSSQSSVLFQRHLSIHFLFSALRVMVARSIFLLAQGEGTRCTINAYQFTAGTTHRRKEKAANTHAKNGSSVASFSGMQAFRLLGKREHAAMKKRHILHRIAAFELSVQVLLIVCRSAVLHHLQVVTPPLHIPTTNPSATEADGIQ